MNQQEIDRQSGYRPGAGLVLTKDGYVLLGRGVGIWNMFRFEDDAVTTIPHENWEFGWDLPQGGIEPGETFRQATLREAHEELGPGWELNDRMNFLRREQMSFPVNKDGRSYRGKTYYYHSVEVRSTPEHFDDWVYGPSMDDGPFSYPTPGFPGGVQFLGHGDACDVIVRSRKGRKGQLVLSILNDLRRHRLIRP